LKGRALFRVCRPEQKRRLSQQSPALRVFIVELASPSYAAGNFFVDLIGQLVIAQLQCRHLIMPHDPAAASIRQLSLIGSEPKIAMGSGWLAKVAAISGHGTRSRDPAS